MRDEVIKYYLTVFSVSSTPYYILPTPLIQDLLQTGLI